MQGINATLIVQAINFGIAYLILRKLVFAPGVALVLEERVHEARLNNEVFLATEYTQSEQERLAAEWASEQKKLARKIPALPEELFVLRHIKPEISIEALPTEHEMVETKKTLVKALVYSVEAKR
jgi:hypothetical protein